MEILPPIVNAGGYVWWARTGLVGCHNVSHQRAAEFAAEIRPGTAYFVTMHLLACMKYMRSFLADSAEHRLYRDCSTLLPAPL
jgi:hypothetical protein